MALREEGGGRIARRTGVALVKILGADPIMIRNLGSRTTDQWRV